MLASPLQTRRRYIDWARGIAVLLMIEAHTTGITRLRHLPVLGYSDLPRGHGDVIFENVRVPAENLILREGAGFELWECAWVFPVFEKYRWLPDSVIRRYQDVLPILERIPLLRRLGVSTFIVARRPSGDKVTR